MERVSDRFRAFSDFCLEQQQSIIAALEEFMTGVRKKNAAEFAATGHSVEKAPRPECSWQRGGP